MPESAFKNRMQMFIYLFFPTVMHTCSRCDATFTDLSNLTRHILMVHEAAGGFTFKKGYPLLTLEI